MTCFKDIDFHLFIESLTRTIEIKDVYTAGHSRRVSEIAELICRGLHMSDTHCDYVHVIGHLHDIGKIGIAEGILMKSGKSKTTGKAGGLKDWEPLKAAYATDPLTTLGGQVVGKIQQ